jgi:hypothetical protein
MMRQPEPTGNMELRDHFIKLARDYERRADERKSVIRAKVADEMQHRYARTSVRMSKKEFELRVDEVTNVRCAGTVRDASSGDPLWKGFVAMNQWYTNYAVMYGTAAAADETRSLRETIDSLMRYLRERDWR